MNRIIKAKASQKYQVSQPCGKSSNSADNANILKHVGRLIIRKILPQKCEAHERSLSMVGCKEKYEEHEQSIDTAEDAKICEAREECIEIAETAEEYGDHEERNEMVWANRMKSI